MLVEIFIITLGWTFNPLYHVIILQVIWAIGISMILLGLLVWLPFNLILTIGVIIVFGHNLLDYPEAERQGNVNIAWKIVHSAFFVFVQYAPGRGFLFVYAFLPQSGGRNKKKKLGVTISLTP